MLGGLKQVTNQAVGDVDNNIANSWGVHKNRIVRTSTGDIFTVYISLGSDHHNHTWHLMHRAPNDDTWQDVHTGNAGSEPVNILVGPHDTIHVLSWPHLQGQAEHTITTDLGKSFTTENIPGHWRAQEQGYSGSGINAQGDMVFFQSGDDKPGQFLWSYYSHTTQQWQFHITTFDFRYTYAFFFPGNHNDLTMVGVRDIQREEAGYATSSNFNYIFDAIRYFYIGDVNKPDSTFSKLQVVQPTPPQNTDDSDVIFLTDSYIDTYGRTHVLYNNLYDGQKTLHHVVIENGQIVKNVQLNIDFGPRARIVQDTQGHFYIISMANSGNTINVYPGSSSDTDGTQLNDPVKLDISQFPGCTNYDMCHSPTLTLPRNGNAVSDTLDGTYGNFTKEISFRITLRSGTSFAPTQAPLALAGPQKVQSTLLAEEKRK